MKQIRNFSIIAHIDHGKSTLADRMLEHTKTVEARKMKEQVLDSMELERERGITIKMQPVRMVYDSPEYGEVELNLIDTPGHIDFSYEVSRALRAVEGVLLLVDSTQGVQAQTLTTLQMAKELDLTIIPVLTKTDMPHARSNEVTTEVCELISCTPNDVHLVSGKTGEGVSELLETIVEKVPVADTEKFDETQALVFDFEYSSHKGVIVFARVMSGQIKKGDELRFVAGDATFHALEVGALSPDARPMEVLSAGEIGYIVTCIKEPGVANVGDTITDERNPSRALAGYKEPPPVVWVSIFPESQDDFTALKQALDRLRLSDSSLSFEEES